MEQCQRFIEELGQIVNPRSGNFNIAYISHVLSSNFRYIYENDFESTLQKLAEIIHKSDGSFIGILKLLTGRTTQESGLISSLVLRKLMVQMQEQEEVSAGEWSKNGLKYLSILNKNIGKYGENEAVTLSSTVLNYLSVLCGLGSAGEKSGFDITSDILSLFKSSVDVESGLYKYFEKTLHPYEVAKLDLKAGKVMAGLSWFSSFAGTASDGIDAYKVYIDPNSTVYDKAAQSIMLGSSVIDWGGKTYIVSKAGSKTLQFVSSVDKESKAVNQILATEQKLQYATSATVAKKIGKINVFVDMVNVGASTIAGGTKRFGEVTEDGKFDMIDAGSVGVYGSLSGLNTVTSTLTLGLVEFDSEAVAGELENNVDTFLQGDSWAAEYVRDKNNDAVSRFGVSVGIGAYLVGEKIVGGVADGAKTVGSWASAGWNMLTNLF